MDAGKLETDLYVDPVPAHLCGASCRLPMVGSVHLSCGHRLDLHCYKSLPKDTEEKLTCPVCKKEVKQDQAFPDKECNKLVHCWKFESGCHWQGKRSQLPDHWYNCDYNKVPCERAGCPDKIAKVRMAVHLRDECLWRQITCQWCRRNMKFLQLKDHELECGEVQVGCPYNCEEKLKQKEMEEHVQVCPLRKYNCTFEGCNSELKSKEDLLSHLKAYVVHHVTCANDRYLKLRQTVEDVQSDDKKFSDFHSVSQEIKQSIEAESTKLDGIEEEISHLRTQQKSMEEKTTGACRQSVVNLCLEMDGRLTGINQYISVLSEKIDKMELITTSNKGRLDAQDERLTTLSDTAVTNALKQQFSAQDRVLAIHDIKLVEHSLRLDMMDCKDVNGVLLWKITEIRRRRHEAISGKTVSIYSQPFYTSSCGYKMCARLYLDGDGIGKHTHLSLFFVIMRGQYDSLMSWPFTQKVTLILMDQIGGRHIIDAFHPDPRSSSFQRPKSEMNIASGCPLFTPLDRLDSENYVKEDIMFIKIVVDTAGVCIPDSRSNLL